MRSHADDPEQVALAVLPRFQADVKVVALAQSLVAAVLVGQDLPFLVVEVDLSSDDWDQHL
ncbi:MAG: hypothetical protein MPN21_26250 [Thermoanaerobaculia bacterium]|nr:hypothetical protein [Thermoanaerobaculia bacterium]